MNQGEITRNIMIQSALSLINYLIKEDIKVIDNNDYYIIYLISNTQCQLNEYVVNNDKVQQKLLHNDSMNEIRNNTIYRQGVIRQLLAIVYDGVNSKLDLFNHVSIELLETLSIK